MADGSITIVADLDAKKAQAELNRLTTKIDNAKRALNEKGAQQNAIKAELETATQEALNTTDRIQDLKRELESVRAMTSAQTTAGAGDPAALMSAMEREKQITTELAQQEGILKQQDIQVEKLAGQYDKVSDAVIKGSQDVAMMETRAGELTAQLTDAGSTGEETGDQISTAMQEAAIRVEKLGRRILGLFKRVFFFSLITQALRGLRSWLSDVVKSNDEASAAIARLKGALLTLAQPIMGVIIPALTKLLNVLTSIISVIASIVSTIFGTTARESAEAAKAFQDEKNAIKGVGGAASKASKQLAGFDEINKISGDTAGGGGGGAAAQGADFSGTWLDDVLSGVEAKVTAGLLLGGVALIAIGAAVGSLGLVLAGLALIGAGIAYGQETGTLNDWAKTLGLDRAESMVTAALLIAGMAAVVIGVATGNILLFIAGATLIGAGLKYGQDNAVISDWAAKLGLDSAAELVTAAALAAGVAAVVIGIATGNILLFVSGAMIVGAAIVYGKEEGVFGNWAEKLGLDSVYKYVTTALQLVGIALIAIGAAMGNIFMVIAGGVMLFAGIAASAIGEKKLKEWWETLRLTRVQQWVGVVTMLAGIALIAIGAAMANILMIIGGMVLIGIGTLTNTAEGNLKDWVTVLGLEKVAGWVTGALLLGGIALLVIGIVTANIPMVLAGLGLLGAGISVGITSGTFASWLGSISQAFHDFKEDIVETFNQLWDGVKGYINSLLAGIESMANGIVRGINKAIDAINTLSFTIPDWVPELGGKSIGFNIRHLGEVSIPRLAQGAVIPPNRQFLAVLGDQTSGRNIEAPEGLIREIVGSQMQPLAALLQQLIEIERDGKVMQINDTVFARVVYSANKSESRRVGGSLVNVTRGY